MWDGRTHARTHRRTELISISPVRFAVAGDNKNMNFIHYLMLHFIKVAITPLSIMDSDIHFVSCSGNELLSCIFYWQRTAIHYGLRHSSHWSGGFKEISDSSLHNDTDDPEQLFIPIYHCLLFLQQF